MHPSTSHLFIQAASLGTQMLTFCQVSTSGPLMEKRMVHCMAPHRLWHTVAYMAYSKRVLAVAAANSGVTRRILAREQIHDNSPFLHPYLQILLNAILHTRQPPPCHISASQCSISIGRGHIMCVCTSEFIPCTCLLQADCILVRLINRWLLIQVIQLHMMHTRRNQCSLMLCSLWCLDAWCICPNIILPAHNYAIRITKLISLLQMNRHGCWALGWQTCYYHPDHAKRVKLTPLS